jgi:hypothetical protein
MMVLKNQPTMELTSYPVKFKDGADVGHFASPPGDPRAVEWFEKIQAFVEATES